MDTDQQPIPVDLANPESIRNALPLVQKRKADAKSVYEYWDSLESTMRMRLEGGNHAESSTPEPASPEPPAGPPRAAADSGTTLDMVVRVVNEAKAPIRSRDVKAILSNHGLAVTSGSVSNSLYYAAHREDPLVQKWARGVYAPLSYREEPDQATSPASGGSEVDPVALP